MVETILTQVLAWTEVLLFVQAGYAILNNDAIAAIPPLLLALHLQAERHHRKRAK